MCPFYTREIKQYSPCKLEQHSRIPSIVIPISILLAVTFLLEDKCGSDKHPTVRAPSPTARLNQHAVVVSPVKRGKWIQAACKHNIGREGEAGGDLPQSSVTKTSTLDLTLKGKTDECVLKLYVLEDWHIGDSNSRISWWKLWHWVAL